MTCPACGAARPRVVESRHTARQVRRRRVCRGCGHRFLTVEVEARCLTVAPRAVVKHK